MTVSNKLLCQTCAAEMKTATGRSLRACVQCGDGTNLYVDAKPICNRCDRQTQAVRRLRQMLDEQEKKQRHAEAPISCKASAQQFGGGAQGAEEPLGAHWQAAAPLVAASDFLPPPSHLA
jgi:hypothetical protein